MKKGEKMSDELRQKLSGLAKVRCDTDEFRGKMSVIGFQRVYKHPTHCRRGHEFTPENTYIDKRGHYTCLTCANSLEQRRRNSTRTAAVKLEVLTQYSPNGILKCSWKDCDICDPDLLTLDHINNDGAQQRKIHGSGVGAYYYARQNGFPDGFQTLCWNHQWKKEILRRHEKSNL